MIEVHRQRNNVPYAIGHFEPDMEGTRVIVRLLPNPITSLVTIGLIAAVLLASALRAMEELRVVGGMLAFLLVLVVGGFAYCAPGTKRLIATAVIDQQAGKGPHNFMKMN
jgi:hypothetical protein